MSTCGNPFPRRAAIGRNPSSSGTFRLHGKTDPEKPITEEPISLNRPGHTPAQLPAARAPSVERLSAECHLVFGRMEFGINSGADRLIRAGRPRPGIGLSACHAAVRGGSPAS
jgi:hypothetical protein